MSRGETLRRIESLTDDQFERIAPFLEADLDVVEEVAADDRPDLIQAIDRGLESAMTGSVLDHETVIAMGRERLSRRP